jgi:Zn-dependent protease
MGQDPRDTYRELWGEKEPKREPETAPDPDPEPFFAPVLPVDPYAGDPSAADPYARQYEPVQPRGTNYRGFLSRIWAPVAAIGAFLAKFGGFLFKAKFFFSIFISAGVYIWLGTVQQGWPAGLWFGLGLIALLFVHEMGHVVEAKRQGLPVSAPLFIPFMGAAILMKRMPQDAWHEALVGIAGPLLGSAGAAALWITGEAIDSRPLIALGFLGFLLNLFNLLPVVPLDGGRIVAALHPAIWILGFAGLLAVVVIRPNPLLLLIVLVAGMELYRRWRERHSPGVREYYKVTAARRLIIGLLYFGLAAALVFGMHATHVPRDF